MLAVYAVRTSFLSDACKNYSHTTVNSYFENDLLLKRKPIAMTKNSSALVAWLVI